jgi:hypothetical protein
LIEYDIVLAIASIQESLVMANSGLREMLEFDWQLNIVPTIELDA